MKNVSSRFSPSHTTDSNAFLNGLKALRCVTHCTAVSTLSRVS